MSATAQPSPPGPGPPAPATAPPAAAPNSKPAEPPAPLPPTASLHAAAGSYEFSSLGLPDGRQLSYACMGAPLAGAKLVLLYFHGVPASLVEAEPLAAAARPLGVALVAFDRPGMGASSPDPDVSVASVVADAEALMDALGLQQAVAVGESGGAPYAAGFAALRPARVQQLLLVAGLAATNGPQHARLRRSLNSMDRMSMHGRRMGITWTLNKFVKLAADRTPGMVKRGAGMSLGRADARFLVGNQAAKDWLLRFMQRAYLAGVGGVLSDYRVLGGDWGGVGPAAVQARTAIWHGGGDEIVPVCHSEWYAGLISGSQLRVVEGEGHVSLMGRHGGRIVRDVLTHAGLGDGGEGSADQGAAVPPAPDGQQAAGEAGARGGTAAVLAGGGSSTGMAGAPSSASGLSSELSTFATAMSQLEPPTSPDPDC